MLYKLASSQENTFAIKKSNLFSFPKIVKDLQLFYVLLLFLLYLMQLLANLALKHYSSVIVFTVRLGQYSAKSAI